MTIEEMLELLEVETIDEKVSIPYEARKLRDIATKLREQEAIIEEQRKSMVGLSAMMKEAQLGCITRNDRIDEQEAALKAADEIVHHLYCQVIVNHDGFDSGWHRKKMEVVAKYRVARGPN